MRWPVWLLDRQVQQAVEGLALLRRAYEHVLVLAVLEGAQAVRRDDYEGYVDALRLLSSKAEFIARKL
jgi:hypothetical protein